MQITLHCWISDEKGKSIRSLFRKLKVSKEIWDEHNSIFSRKYRYRTDVTTEESKVVQLPKNISHCGNLLHLL